MARANPVTEGRRSLYERDFCLWLEQQAALLREGRLDELDVANLLEEIESMGRKDKKSLKSDLVIVLLHLLKHEFQPKRRSRSWLDSILEHRQRLRDDLEESPSLRGHLVAVFPYAYADARARASTQTRATRADFPANLTLHAGAGPRRQVPARLGGLRQHRRGRVKPRNESTAQPAMKAAIG
jgi:Domain of unknown function DUF29